MSIVELITNFGRRSLQDRGKLSVYRRGFKNHKRYTRLAFG